jgi:hypothetical protein
MADSFGARAALTVGARSFEIFRLDALDGADRLPYSLRILLENLLRTENGVAVPRSFQTPLGTNHAFQGWADRFLITPRDGIQDLYFTLKATIAAFDFIAVYHRFRSDNLSYDFGDEFDLHAIYHLREKVSLNLRSAYYMADANPLNVERNAAQNLDRDKTVFWAFLEFEF